MGVKMGLKALGAIVIAAAVGFAAWPTDAATSTKKQRTRVVVTKRSYLDAGTEVKPGEWRGRGIDFMAPPGFTPYSYYDPTNSYRYPLPDPFWLPGYTGPYGPGGY
jgi:hypothetical protein